MLLKTNVTRVIVCCLFLFVAESSADGNNKSSQLERKRNLRPATAGTERRAGRNRKNLTGKQQDKTDSDVIEDVIFWTRTLQDSSMPNPTRKPTPRPTPRPTRRPTSRPNPSPNPQPETPDPTRRPTRNPTPAPTRKPTPSPTQTTPVTPAPAPVPVGGPVIRDDAVTITADDFAFIDVLENDTPAPGQTLAVQSIVSDAANGGCTIGVDLVSVAYIPNAGFVGTDTCVYEACDLIPECGTATISIEVEPGLAQMEFSVPLPTDGQA